jgi:hypothetical protein
LGRVDFLKPINTTWCQINVQALVEKARALRPVPANLLAADLHIYIYVGSAQHMTRPAYTYRTYPFIYINGHVPYIHIGLARLYS